MSQTTPPSGVDLARIALHQVREAAKARGAAGGTRKAKRQPRAVGSRRDGRELAGFAAVLQGLMADRAWDVPAAGGSLLGQWPAIAAAVAPRLPEHVQAVAFHPETGQLDLRPDSPAYATQLRLISARIVAAANEWSGNDAVRTVQVLAVGAASAPRPARPAPEAPAALCAPQAPVKTREMASPGYHQALAAHQAVASARRVDPGIAEVVEWQTRVMRELSRRAFPEPDPVAEDASAPIEQARVQRHREAAATEAAAVRRARAGGRAGRGPHCRGRCRSGRRLDLALSCGD
ncbi:DUF721 domain-containing protein [Streptomyces sp. ISL-44]|uniref:DciA family protein n=1 Tax=Streptomyces sp. ISL-44 TaxID=2819184 RepID=UPI001BE8AF82|nr:DciA family protein [Streptomyces sp. ISL-44]MBT2544985.1 DUF721 domain-containing protein [Streptomyces sp. ISL-44]